MGKKAKVAIWVIVALLIIGLLGYYCYTIVTMNKSGNVHPEVSFEIENYGTIKMELYPEYAPNTVANIIALVEAGYYNDKVFYGKDEMCLYLGRDSQGEAVNPKQSLITSDIEADSDSDYEYTINGEFVTNGYKNNTLSFEKGVVGLIRNDYTQYVQTLSTESYNSGNAQIGVMMSDEASNLNGVYCAFGRITEGMEILEKMYNEEVIAVEETEGTDETATEDTTSAAAKISKFAAYPLIKSTSVDKKGVNYPLPTTQKAFDYEAYLYNMFSQYYSTEQQ